MDPVREPPPLKRNVRGLCAFVTLGSALCAVCGVAFFLADDDRLQIAGLIVGIVAFVACSWGTLIYLVVTEPAPRYEQPEDQQTNGTNECAACTVCACTPW
jgi:hypothetical protein